MKTTTGQYYTVYLVILGRIRLRRRERHRHSLLADEYRQEP